jgi:hypothetical protein
MRRAEAKRSESSSGPSEGEDDTSSAHVSGRSEGHISSEHDITQMMRSANNIAW